MKQSHRITLFITGLAASFFLWEMGLQPSVIQGKTRQQHQQLKFENDFSNPKEVIEYYCGRDASGFVWSGLLDIERRAFTTWKHIPQNDSFYVASGYQIHPPKYRNAQKTLAEVEVHYQLLGMGDAHGTRVPTSQHRKVTFHLKKIGGRWKIDSPQADALYPVVIEAKFPYASL